MCLIYMFLCVKRYMNREWKITMRVRLYGTQKLRFGSAARVKTQIFVLFSVVADVPLGD